MMHLLVVTHLELDMQNSINILIMSNASTNMENLDLDMQNWVNIII